MLKDRAVMWRFAGYFHRLLGRFMTAEADFVAGIYRHDAARRPTEFLADNLIAGRGFLKSISETRRIHGERFFAFDDAYPITGGGAEEVWETVRQTDHPGKPSRRGAFILLDCTDPQLTVAALDPMAFRCRIRNTSRIHRGDRNWFGRRETDWTAAAASYWSGLPDESAEPLWEYVVDGEIQVLDWDKAPLAADESRPSQPRATYPKELVICPACGIEFIASPPAIAVITTADRPRCIVDPSLPFLSDCPNVEPLIAAAWARLNDLEKRGRQE